ncbi:glycerol-3-phosphate acyltransferase [Chloroflexota bacterium]
MSELLFDILLLIVSYLIGSIPYMVLLSRAKGVDLSLDEDVHIAMYRKVGRLAGLSGVFVDVFKGVVPVLIGFFLGFNLLIVAFAGVAAVCGQMWPVFQKFNGEKGNTTGIGVMITLCFVYGAYLAFIVCALSMLIGFLVRTVPRVMVKGQTLEDRLAFSGPVSNSLPLGMIIGFASLPLVSWLTQHPIELTLAFLCMFLVIVVRRLTAGLTADLKEPRTGVGSILINRLLYDRSYY